MAFTQRSLHTLDVKLVRLYGIVLQAFYYASLAPCLWATCTFTLESALKLTQARC